LSRIQNINCIEGIKSLRNNSINLVITSPPYNLDKNTKNKKIIYNSYHDNKEYNTYISWLKEIFELLFNKMTLDGRICINIGDQKNGAIPTHSYIMDFMLSLGYKNFTTIIWNKSQTNRRTAWGSFNSPSCPSFPTTFEYIMIFYSISRKLIHKGKSDLEKREFIDWTIPIWNIAPETRMKKFGHPSMFPEEIPRRLIKMFSYVGDLVLDPFNGLGTTCKVAKDLEREYIGFEIDKTYYDKTIKRLNGEKDWWK